MEQADKKMYQIQPVVQHSLRKREKHSECYT
jgi:hypothetical protein